MSTSKTNVFTCSTPPSKEELDNLQVVKAKNLPKKYTRDLSKRIFVNRSMNLEWIKYVGFDMDYTLAVYKSPAYESLSYNLAVQKLIKKGYPKEITQFKYDPSFPIRGLFLDKKTGILLKLDAFGYILNCVKGRKTVTNVREIYPTRIVHPEETDRFFVIDTLFGLPEACLYADLIEYFETRGITVADTDDVVISYKSIFEDVRSAIHTSHIDNSIKNEVVSNLDTYVERSSGLATLLHRLKSQNRKTFLLTNSEYSFTNAMMGFLLHGMRDDYKSWTEYFDIIITSASKPAFFLSGTTLREVDAQTGTLKFTQIKQFVKGNCYAGGNLNLFRQFTGTSGSEVLYIGDNIYHDIVFSKKSRCLWRTLLVVRELDQETSTWQANAHKYDMLENLEYLRAKTYQKMDSALDSAPDAKQLKHYIRSAAQDLNTSFNKWFGSVFRSGSSESFFSSQMQRYCDLYASDYLHLLHYPFFYYFSALSKMLPHEKQVMLELDEMEDQNQEKQ